MAKKVKNSRKDNVEITDNQVIKENNYVYGVDLGVEPKTKLDNSATTKVLILGAAGYLGSLLSQKLSQNKDLCLTAIDSFEYGHSQQKLVQPVWQNANIRLMQRNIAKSPLSEEFIQEFDVIFNLAAIVGAPACDKDPKKATAINLTAAKDIVDKLGEDQLLIYPNTNSSYGTTKAGDVCTENTPLHGISLYAKDKDKVEQYIRKNHKKHVIFRLATVFGTSPRTRMDLLVNTMIYEGTFGGIIKVFDPNLRRNYVHVEDVIDGFIFAMNDTKLHGNVYNLGLDSANMTKLELAQKIAALTHGRVVIGKGKDPDQRDYLVSSEKLKEAGFEATRTLEYGVSQIMGFCVSGGKGVMGGVHVNV